MAASGATSVGPSAGESQAPVGPGYGAAVALEELVYVLVAAIVCRVA